MLVLELVFLWSSINSISSHFLYFPLPLRSLAYNSISAPDSSLFRNLSHLTSLYVLDRLTNCGFHWWKENWNFPIFGYFHVFSSFDLSLSLSFCLSLSLSLSLSLFYFSLLFSFAMYTAPSRTTSCPLCRATFSLPSKNPLLFCMSYIEDTFNTLYNTLYHHSHTSSTPITVMFRRIIYRMTLW